MEILKNMKILFCNIHNTLSSPNGGKDVHNGNGTETFTQQGTVTCRLQKYTCAVTMTTLHYRV
jgi:hypothetical protein